MKVTPNQVRGAVKSFRSINAALIGTCILAPLVQTFSAKAPMQFEDYLPMLIIVVVATILLFFLCWFLDGVADHLEELETKCDHITRHSNLHMFD